MSPNYARIYQDLYYGYIESIRLVEPRAELRETEYSLIRALRKSIERADSYNSLRSDAKYFLLVNFHQLIIRPLLANRRVSRIAFEKQSFLLEDDIQADVNLIVGNVIRSTGESAPPDEISGHQIMRSVDLLWGQLRTAKFEIWG